MNDGVVDPAAGRLDAAVRASEHFYLRACASEDGFMHLTVATTTPVVASPTDPHQPTLPGLETDVLARYASYGNELTAEVKIRRDKPVDVPVFSAFDDAVSAARTIMVADRKEARWGLFNRNPGRVESIALLDAKDGIQLVRTTLAVDRYKEPVPGQMFPGQNWWVGTPDAIVREQPSTLAIVGADNLFDLRSGTPAAPVPFAEG